MDNILFEQFDLLDEKGQFEGSFDFVIDKGTFDAITLSEDANEADRKSLVASITAKFKSSLRKALYDPSSPTVSKQFIITSCNWTVEELKLLFGPEFEAVDEVVHPSFTFGGRQGQTVTTLIFSLLKSSS